MGLLDEAIKDHLELKRRHGADPGEVARLEHEALGPARREPVAEAEVAEEPLDEVVSEPAAAPEPAPEPAPAEDDYEADEVPADERLEAPVRRLEPEPEATVDQPTAQFSLEELEDAEETGEEEAEEPPAEPHADVVPADEEPEGDDVLEETPEFLQETPEHDRLWFEQKPPRDFDF
jgi:hypothetical protein